MADPAAPGGAIVKMAPRADRPLLVCNIGWMTRYQGISGQPDKISGGGRYVDEHGHGHECCNFVACADGKVYGHVETIKGKSDRKISLERLGASPSAQWVEHVDVVWVATDPEARGRKVAGFYLGATVWRQRQRHAKPPSRQHASDAITDFIIRADAENAYWIPPEHRDIGLSSGPGWIGRVNWWYPQSSRFPDVAEFLHRVELLFGNRWRAERANGRMGTRFGRMRDPLRNTLVEQAAIDIVTRHYAGYTVKSVEKDNRGWDLEVFPDSGARRAPTLRLEVKGLSGANARIGVTPNEYKALQQHRCGQMRSYRLCVVTGALAERPTLRILRYERETMRWIDDVTAAPIEVSVNETVAAIVNVG